MSKPKLEKLIQEIAMFDMVAAFTLYCRVGIGDYEDKYDLSEVMEWSETPEGYEHWGAINTKLIDRRNNYHPHRDLMIEYANDKTIKVQNYYEYKWQDLSEPAFFIEQQYRKKPKVTKKVIEYRLYLDKENEIHMIERQDLIHPAHFKQWLGDWQNVEIEVEENN